MGNEECMILTNMTKDVGKLEKKFGVHSCDSTVFIFIFLAVSFFDCLVNIYDPIYLTAQKKLVTGNSFVSIKTHLVSFLLSSTSFTEINIQCQPEATSVC